MDHEDYSQTAAHAAGAERTTAPVFYCDEAYPDGVVRAWPDGRRELVRVEADGAITVLRPLPDSEGAA